jgi:RNA polymerase sigma-70 factor (ECF subfamily)
VTTKEYNTCVELHSDGVFRFIVKNIRRQADAEDIVQVAFERLWKQHKTVAAERARSFLFTTAYRYMIDWIRKNKNMSFPGQFSEGQLGHTHASERSFEARELLEKALKQLSEVQRSVLLLRDYEGYSYKEIATIVALTEAQVKVYIFRARKKLKKIINNAHETA